MAKPFLAVKISALKDSEYMFGKIFENLATFWERKNLTEIFSVDVSNHISPSLAMPIISVHHTTATTPLLFNNQHGSFLEKFAIESSGKFSNSDMLVNRLNSHEIRSA